MEENQSHTLQSSLPILISRGESRGPVSDPPEITVGPARYFIFVLIDRNVIIDSLPSGRSEGK
jgi:hypothetical protein